MWGTHTLFPLQHKFVSILSLNNSLSFEKLKNYHLLVFLCTNLLDLVDGLLVKQDPLMFTISIKISNVLCNSHQENVLCSHKKTFCQINRVVASSPLLGRCLPTAGAVSCWQFPESSMCRILICDVQSLMFNCAIVQAQFRDSQGEGRTQCWSLHGAPTTSRRSTRWINLKLRINLSHWRQIFRQIWPWLSQD